MQRYAVLVFWVLMMFQSIHAQAGSWIPKGPPGTDIVSLAVDPLDPTVAYGATLNEIYKTTNAGQLWTRATTGLPMFSQPNGGYLLAIDPEHSAQLWAAAQSIFAGRFLLTSSDAAATWFVLPAFELGSGSTINALAVVPGTGQALVGAPDGLFLFGGGTDPQQIVQSRVTAVTIDPQTGIAYAATDIGVFKSNDPSVPQSWVQMSGLGNTSGTYIDTLATDPHDPATVYAGTSFGSYKSIDGGMSWDLLDLLPRFEGQASFVVDPADANIVYVASVGDLIQCPSGTVFRSDDAGVTWSRADGGLPAGTAESRCPVGHLWDLAIGCRRDAPVREGGACDSTTPVIYLATSEGVFTSSDRARTWHDVNAGLPSGRGVAQVAVACEMDDDCQHHPATPRTLYALLGNGGLSKSTDEGATWRPLVVIDNPSEIQPLHRVLAMAIDPNDTESVYAATDFPSGFWKSSDRGTTWHRAQNGLPRSLLIRLVKIDPVDPATLYAVDEETGVYKSTDGAASWTPVNEGLPAGGEVLDLAIAPANHQILYVSVTPFLSEPAPLEVFKSSDAGRHWQIANKGLPTGEAPDLVAGLAIDQEDAGTVYASTSFGLFKTSDGGDHWDPLGSELARHLGLGQILTVPGQPATVYAASQLVGVIRSIDRGISWDSFNTGLPTSAISDLTVHPGAPSRLYAGTAENVIFGRGVFAFAECGDGYLDRELGEVCDAGDANEAFGPSSANGAFTSCCRKATPELDGCLFIAGGTTCGPAKGPCDAPDFCSGVGADCVDVKLTGVCREASTVCDVAERCDGVHDDCPLDGFAPHTRLCRPAEGPCDKDDFCTGVGPDCPDEVVAFGALCGNPGDICNGRDKGCQFNCGNGIVETELGEECDDGDSNGTPGDRCRRDCQLKCGDGIVDPLEQCDGGPHCTSSCRLMCTDDADCCAGDANCNRNNACTRALCEGGLCATEPGCAGDPCTGSSDLAGLESCFRQLGGAKCRSPRDRKVANRVNRQLPDRLAELQTLPDLCGSSRTQKRIPKLLKRMRRKLGQLQLLVARNVGDPECYNELTGFAPASDGRLAYLDLQVQKLGVQAICQPAKPGA
jgi:photosystem II stability/assembly factor-like uncharacterized protein